MAWRRVALDPKVLYDYQLLTRCEKGTCSPTLYPPQISTVDHSDTIRSSSDLCYCSLLFLLPMLYLELWRTRRWTTEKNFPSLRNSPSGIEI